MIVIEAQVLSNHSARAKGLSSTSYASKRIHLLKEHRDKTSSRQRLPAIHDVTDLYANLSVFAEHPTLPYRSDSLTISSVQ